MSNQASNQPNTSIPWEQRLREARESVETDFRQVVTYINDEVVPDIRRHGSQALRVAATELQRLAQRMDEAHTPVSPPVHQRDL